MGMGKARSIACAICEATIPALGMSMVWPLLRYASFFMLLYPTHVEAIAKPWPISAHEAFLAALAVLVIATIAAWKPIQRLFMRHRWLPTALGCLTTVGVLLAFARQAGWGDPALWLSIPCVAIGFSALFVGWGAFFAGRMACGQWVHTLCILGVSFWASYELFSQAGLLGPIDGGRVTAALMPVGSALLLGLTGILDAHRDACEKPKARDTENAGGHEEPRKAAAGAGLRENSQKVAGESGDAGEEGRFSPRVAMTPLLALVAAFLIVGSAVRGIVDSWYPPDDSSRVGLSFAMVTLVALGGLACWAFELRRDRLRAAEQAPVAERGPAIVTTFSLICWMAFALVFLAGLFAFLVLDDKRTGGDAVVVGRTMMEFVLWLLLCGAVATRGVAALPTFTLYGLGVEVLSWIVSYVAIPRALVALGPAGIPSPANALVLTTAFGIIAIGLVASGIYLVVSPRWRLLSGGLSPNDSEHTEGDDRAHAGTQAQAAREPGVRWPSSRPVEVGGETGPGFGATPDVYDVAVGLTEREAAVATLYARGYSLGKVAEELGITKSTAQSHIKHAYRKLGVHSRDELIERLGG